MKRILELNNRENIEVDLEEKEKGFVLSISGNLKNSAGQNNRDIYEKYVMGENEFIKKAELIRLLEIWERYHLNDMRPGTPKQMEALRSREVGENAIEGYMADSSYLKNVDLYNDNGYEYGSAWLFEEIPAEVINELKDIVENW